MITSIITGMATSVASSAAASGYERSKKYLPDVNKNYIWGALALAGIVYAIYYYGKKNATINPAPLPADTQPSVDPTTGTKTNPLTDTESKDITRLANGLNSQLGYFSEPDLTLLNDFLGSSDRVFVGTYNYYNTLYCSPPDTMKTKFESYNNWKLWFTDINHQLDAITARMDKLGLK